MGADRPPHRPRRRLACHPGALLYSGGEPPDAPLDHPAAPPGPVRPGARRLRYGGPRRARGRGRGTPPAALRCQGTAPALPDHLAVGYAGDLAVVGSQGFDLRYQYLAGVLAPDAACLDPARAKAAGCGTEWWGTWQWDQEPPGALRERLRRRHRRGRPSPHVHLLPPLPGGPAPARHRRGDTRGDGGGPRSRLHGGLPRRLPLLPDPPRRARRRWSTWSRTSGATRSTRPGRPAPTPTAWPRRWPAPTRPTAAPPRSRSPGWAAA